MNWKDAPYCWMLMPRPLVESSKKIEMVNIIDEDIWNPELTLRPEDEIILRKLHEMLQSTADDLKLLSGELSKYHQPGVQYKTAPTPMDEEFNEKVHIEEVVNAKFHGYQIVDKTPRVPDVEYKGTDSFKTIIDTKHNITNTAVQVNSVPVKPISKKLSVSGTRVMQISVNSHNNNFNVKKMNNGKIINEVPKVAYNEFTFTHGTSKASRKALQVQEMPSINIRSELKEQKVLHLDIIPENKDGKDDIDKKSNVLIVYVQHETVDSSISAKVNQNLIQNIVSKSETKPAVRRISKMSTCESSESPNNASSDAQLKLNAQKNITTERRKKIVSKKVSDRNQKLHLQEWKRKLKDVYAASTSQRNITSVKTKSSAKNKSSLKDKKLNNSEYIPYSKLTLGGVTVSDIEREISNIEDKNDIPLSPILNRNLGSQKNSFNKIAPQKHSNNNNQKILTTSDENLLQEVIDIEKTVSDTLSKNVKTSPKKPVTDNISSISSEVSSKDSYVDDFEEDKSEISGDQIISSHFDEIRPNHYELPHNEISDSNVNKTHKEPHTKSSNLSIKKSVDVFEFIHSIDSQDIAIQISTSNKITPKETQTSPRNEKPTIQPIHNDLWPSIDPRGEIEKILKLEKDFIKKLIIEEYGDVLEKSINKPSTSKNEDCKNVVAFQKNTQTSPARMKSVMTSPQRTKTRTTSPLINTITDHQTSPIIIITNEAEPNVDEDLAVSLNLSSPRFSLRLPQNSRDVFSNLETSGISSKDDLKTKTSRKIPSTTSSIDADNSSSELSSLGEIKLKIKKNRKRTPSVSESSNTSSKYSSDFQSTSILPLRSEGEVSSQMNKRKSRKNIRSEGETSAEALKQS